MEAYDLSPHRYAIMEEPMSMPMEREANDTTIYANHDGDWRAPGNKLGALDHLNPSRFRYFDRVIPHWEGLEVLDIGCGAGFTAEFLAKRGACVSGIDPSDPALRAAKAHAEATHLTIDYRLGSAEHLPYPDVSFDVVVCVDVLEHVGDLEKSLQEAFRVLRRGGYLLFDTINQTRLAKTVMIGALENVLHIIPRGAHDWNLFITPARLRQCLMNAGFDNVQLSGFPLMSVMYIGCAQKN